MLTFLFPVEHANCGTTPLASTALILCNKSHQLGAPLTVTSKVRNQWKLPSVGDLPLVRGMAAAR